jgi:uncharacterized protein YkwD
MRLRATLGSFGIAGALLLGQCEPQCAPPPPAPAPAPAPPPTSAAVQQVVDLTNARRAEAGLPPLAVHGALSLAAQVHSDDQAARQQMSHTGSDGSNPGQRIAATGYVARAWGENVAYGYPDAASVMDGWMGSDGHRANILSPNFTEIGVAFATSARGTIYWTMELARPA